MTTTVISNMMPYSYGQMTNQAIGRLISANTTLLRLNDAITTASAGYDGTPGTQFESTTPNNLFGVVPSTIPGEQGAAYRYAMESLIAQWRTFWVAAQPYIEQLDNGQMAM